MLLYATFPFVVGIHLFFATFVKPLSVNKGEGHLKGDEKPVIKAVSHEEYSPKAHNKFQQRPNLSRSTTWQVDQQFPSIAPPRKKRNPKLKHKLSKLALIIWKCFIICGSFFLLSFAIIMIVLSIRNRKKRQAISSCGLRSPPNRNKERSSLMELQQSPETETNLPQLPLKNKPLSASSMASMISLTSVTSSGRHVPLSPASTSASPTESTQAMDVIDSDRPLSVPPSENTASSSQPENGLVVVATTGSNKPVQQTPNSVSPSPGPPPAVNIRMGPPQTEHQMAPPMDTNLPAPKLAVKGKTAIPPGSVPTGPDDHNAPPPRQSDTEQKPKSKSWWPF